VCPHLLADAVARRMDVLQRAENESDPIPFGVEAARFYGRICGAVVSAGRKPRRRVADLMIAAIAAAEELPLFTTNPGDFKWPRRLDHHRAGNAARRPARLVAPHLTDRHRERVDLPTSATDDGTVLAHLLPADGEAGAAVAAGERTADSTAPAFRLTLGS
jgi:hypothetical protein